MAHPIIMPKAGQSMTEGKIVSWLKKEGEPVQQGDPILEIETDKANLEVEAQTAGILRKVLVPEGEIRPVLTLIGVIAAADEAVDLEALQREAEAARAQSAGASEGAGDLDDLMPLPEAPAAPPPAAAAAAAAAPATQAPPAPTAAPSRPPVMAPPPMPPPVMATGATATATAIATAAGHVSASPLARRIAKDRGVDLRRVRGSGPGGRILRRDVEAAPVGPAPAAGDGHALLATPAKPYPPPSPRPPAKVVLEGMRKAIGTALLESKRSIPHFYATVAIDVSALLELKRAHEAAGTKLSVNDFVVRASVVALQDEPRVNCRVFPDRIEYPADSNIGIAVGQEFGLVVPVVMKAQTRDLAGLSAEIKRIVTAANAGKLIGSGQGTFTVSNLGMFGVESFAAIINPPEGAILAVGTVTTEVRPWHGGFLPRSILRTTLSCDHRAVDGVLAARFLARVKHLLESPERL